MTRFHSHNQYCVTWHNDHNMLCADTSAEKVVSHNNNSIAGDIFGFAALCAAAYLALSLGAVLDLIVAGGQ
jgi:hypothetical protein